LSVCLVAVDVVARIKLIWIDSIVQHWRCTGL